MGLSYEDIKVGGLYYITPIKGWNHAVLDLNPNDSMSYPVYIIQPKQIFMIIDMDIWILGESTSQLDGHICIKILHEEAVGWITIHPEDLIRL
ncbi:hypothetical protein EBU71_11390 [bacterium]|jgi:hypothetical protein|nr:hypothetical protein [Candidatus Elulimicrobium humile]